MKKIILMFAAVMTLFTTMTACAKKAETGETASTESVQPDKVLVAYFSATGTTENVARMIATATGGELYKIQPQEEYSAVDLDWTEPTSRCCKENDDPSSRPAIVMNKTDLSQYDVIYLGYPNWWNMAPRIINTFVEAYDLKGKTVILFMTSGGSTIVHSVELLRKDYPEVKWNDGKLLNGVSQSDVDEWVKTLFHC